MNIYEFRTEKAAIAFLAKRPNIFWYQISRSACSGLWVLEF